MHNFLFVVHQANLRNKTVFFILVLVWWLHVLSVSRSAFFITTLRSLLFNASIFSQVIEDLGLV